MARATRSSSAGRSRRPLASTIDQWSVPAPVGIASTAWRPDACISAMVCRHDDASSWLRVLSALTAATLLTADGGRDSGWSQRRGLAGFSLFAGEPRHDGGEDFQIRLEGDEVGE